MLFPEKLTVNVKPPKRASADSVYEKALKPEVTAAVRMFEVHDAVYSPLEEYTRLVSAGETFSGAASLNEMSEQELKLVVFNFQQFVFNVLAPGRIGEPPNSRRRVELLQRRDAFRVARSVT
jgi:hypothetical protein